MSTIEASLQLEIAQYQNALKKAQGEVERFRQKAKNSGDGIANAIFGGLQARAAALGPIIGAAFGGRAIMEAVVNMERLEKMLVAMEGSASGARNRMAELREVARLPGVDFEQAIQGDVRLRAVGLSADLSKKAIEEFGNALALVGGSSADLDGVFTALSQIAAKGNVFAEEINQIAERVPQVRAVMKDVFGTADTEAIQAMGLSAEEFISRMTEGFGGLTRASSGLQDNFSELSTLGMELANDVGAPVVKTLVPAFTELAALIAANKEAFVMFGVGAGEAVRIAVKGVNVLQDAFNALGQAMNSDDSFAESFARNQRVRDTPAAKQPAPAKKENEVVDAGAAGGGDAAAGASKISDAQEKTAQRIKDLQQDIVEMEMQRMTPAERLSKLMEDQAAKIEEMRNQGGLFFDATVEGMRKFAEAQVARGSAGADKTLERLKEILQIQREMEQLQGSLRQSAVEASEAEATAQVDKEKKAIAEEREALEKSIADAKDRQANADALETFRQELEIAEARARGEDDLADSMQRQLDIQQLKARLMEQMKLSEEDALALAERQVDAQAAINAERSKASSGGRYDAEGRRADGRRKIQGYSRERQGGAEEAAARAQGRIDDARAKRVIPSGLDAFAAQPGLRDRMAGGGMFPGLEGAFGPGGTHASSPMTETAAMNAATADKAGAGAARGVEDKLERVVAVLEQGLLGE